MIKKNKKIFMAAIMVAAGATTGSSFAFNTPSSNTPPEGGLNTSSSTLAQAQAKAEAAQTQAKAKTEATKTQSMAGDYRTEAKAEATKAQSMAGDYRTEAKTEATKTQSMAGDYRTEAKAEATKAQSMAGDYRTEAKTEATKAQSMAGDYRTEKQKLVSGIKTEYSAKLKTIKTEAQAKVAEQPKILWGVRKIKESYKGNIQNIKNEINTERTNLLNSKKQIKTLIQKIRTTKNVEEKRALINQAKVEITKYKAERTKLKTSYNTLSTQREVKNENIKTQLESNWQKELATIKWKAISLIKEYRSIAQDKSISKEEKVAKLKAIKEQLNGLRQQYTETVKKDIVAKKVKTQEIKAETKNQVETVRAEKIAAIKHAITTKLPEILKVKLYNRIAKLSADKQILVLKKISSKINNKLSKIKEELANIKTEAKKTRLELKEYVITTVQNSIHQKIASLSTNNNGVNTNELLDGLLK